MPAAAAKPHPEPSSSRSRSNLAPPGRSGRSHASRPTPAASKTTTPPQRQQSGWQSASANEEVDLMILEYLAHCGYDRAAGELKVQLRDRRMGKAQPWRPVGNDVQSVLRERMIKSFERGERAEVFKLWENFVPPLVRRSDRDAQKLEFYLNIYFAIFPLHPVNPRPNPLDMASSMAAFKSFLETDSSQLATSPEFLAYYAMPYVPEIREHPSFSELFTQAWAMALRAKLEDFLSLSHQFASEPRLAVICRSYRELSGADAAIPSKEREWDSHPIQEAHKMYEELKSRLEESELRAATASQGAASERAAMARSAGEATQLAADALLLAQTAEPPPPEQVQALQQRLTSLQHRVAATIGTVPRVGEVPSERTKRGVRGDRGGKLERGERAAGGDGSSDGAVVSLGASMRTLAALDYNKLRRALLGHAEDAALLLQALRWRITKPPRRQRRSALLQFIQAGLLDPEVVGTLLSSQASPEVREQALRLLNLFASEAVGRSYLIRQADLVPQLCDVLTQEEDDSVARQNALGALQKLSLRRQPQNAMIDNEIIAWLVHVLSDVDSLSEYSVEYGTALLMNLSLRTAGKDKCADSKLDTLSVLSQLMESDTMQVRTYVNGTLYSILVRAALKERAQEIGLADSLRALIEHSDETFARQINYILERLESPPAEEAEAGSDGDDDADVEDTEEEDPEDEDEEPDAFPESNLPVLSGVPGIGEELLSVRYLADVGDAQLQDARLRASIDEESERKRQAAAAAREDTTEASGRMVAANPNAPPPRRRHHPDEPLQRPTTPALSTTLQEWEADALPPGAKPEVNLVLETEAAPTASSPAPATNILVESTEHFATPAVVAYPDPTEVDVEAPTIAVRNRLTRTPQQKMRDASELKPTALRPRAHVEPMKRTSQKSIPPVAPPSIGKK